MTIYNASTLPEEFTKKFAGGLTTKYLTQASESQKLSVHMDVVPPGAYASKYHAHTLQEEFFMILGGCGTLRFNGEKHSVSKGDYVCIQCGGENAHQLYNCGTEPLLILHVSTVEWGDICIYPDEDVYLVKELDVAYNKSNALLNWSPEANT